MKKKTFLGQALVEYSVVGLTILAASVGLIVLFGGNLNSVFQGLFKDMGTHNQQTQQFKTVVQALPSSAYVPPPPPPAISNNPPPSTPVAPSGPTTVCVSGTCVDVPGIFNGTSVSTAGANGQQIQEISNIYLMVAEYLAQQGASSSQTTFWKNLANFGHYVGSQGGGLEKLYGFPAGTTILMGGSQTSFGDAESTMMGNMQNNVSGYEYYKSQMSQNGLNSLPSALQDLVVNSANYISGYGNSMLNDGNNGGYQVALVHQSANSICSVSGSISCMKN